MRLLAALGLASAAVMLAGCQIVPPTEQNYASPVFTDYGDVARIQDRVRPPYIWSYPDETMFFIPIYAGPPQSDLNLRAISCAKADDGTLIVTARVQNMGSSLVPPIMQFTGDLGAFRVAARVTWVGGTQQEVESMLQIPLTVGGTVDMRLPRTRYFAADVMRIDVVADPDRVVPDPVRLNNVLSWEGKMDGNNTRCDVVRS